MLETEIKKLTEALNRLSDNLEKSAQYFTVAKLEPVEAVSGKPGEEEEPGREEPEVSPEAKGNKDTGKGNKDNGKGKNTPAKLPEPEESEEEVEEEEDGEEPELDFGIGEDDEEEVVVPSEKELQDRAIALVRQSSSYKADIAAALKKLKAKKVKDLDEDARVAFGKELEKLEKSGK